jgi:hypothetical protein
MARFPPTAVEMLAEMKPDIDRWIGGEEIDFQARYGAEIQSVGAAPFLVELFRRFEDSTLTTYLWATAFLWKDLHFAAWKDVLRSISGSHQATYQFVWFAAPVLGLDILSMIRTDPSVQESARDLVRLQFPSGAPMSGGASERRLLENSGVAPVALWRRLASEGAPMKIEEAILR